MKWPRLIPQDRFDAIGLAFALFVILPIVAMALDNDPPLQVVGWAKPPAAIPRGGSLYPNYKVVYSRACSGENQRIFVDSTNHELKTAPYRFRGGILADHRPVPIGVAFVPPISAPVPYGAAPGPARYQSVTRFYCNPLQKMFAGTRFSFGITFRYPVVDLIIGTDSVPNVTPSKTVFEPVQDGDSAPTEIDDDVATSPSRGSSR